MVWLACIHREATEVLTTASLAYRRIPGSGSKEGWRLIGEGDKVDFPLGVGVEAEAEGKSWYQATVG